jgi:hypothetical protein
MSKSESGVVNEPTNNQHHQLCNMLLDLTKEIRESRKETVQMRTSFNNVVLENASHKATIAMMVNKMNDMKYCLHILERKASQLFTPPPQKRSSPKIGGSPQLYHASESIVQAPVAMDLQDNFASPCYSAVIDEPIKRAPALPKLALQCTFESTIFAKRAGKNKGERLSLILVDMARHKCIYPDQISKSSIPLAWNKNRRYLINYLELVKYACDLCDIQTLATSQNEIELKDKA